MGESGRDLAAAVLPRQAWGADESVRFLDGVERWPPVHAPARALVVHHTRTVNEDPQPEATIRAVYGFHADVRGWGDIGYNYVVGPDGRVFAGRWDDGRPGVVAGHALGHNVGTEGIAVLGKFEDELPTTEAWLGLVRILAARCRALELDPLGTASPLGPQLRRFPTIIGHGDCRPTTCPGAVLAAALPRLRQEVAASLSEPIPAQARVRRQISRNGSPAKAARTASGTTA